MNPQENLNKTLEKREDQYQNIRESIQELFSEVLCYKTETLERTEKKLLQNNKYCDFLSLDNGFSEICENIINKLIDSEPRTTIDFVLLINTISTLINENKKIDWNKLDITKQIAMNEILEWINNNIDQQYYLSFIVDGTQKQYEELVIPFKNYMDKILNEFDKRFINIAPKIKLEKRNEIHNKFKSVYDNVMEQTINKSTEKVRTFISAVLFQFKNHSISIDFDYKDLSHIYGKFNDIVKKSKLFIDEFVNNDYNSYKCRRSESFIINKYKNNKIKFIENNSLYYRPVTDEFINNVKINIGELEKHLEEYKINFHNKLNQINFENETKYDKYKTNIWHDIRSYIEDFTFSFNDIKTILVSKLFDNLINKISCEVFVFSKEYEKLLINKKETKYLTLDNNKYLELYKNEIEKLENDFNNYRNNNAYIIIKKYTEKPNYGKLEDSKIKYPTYNFNILLEFEEELIMMYNKYDINKKIEFIKDNLNDIFNKLYTRNEILNSEYLLKKDEVNISNINKCYFLLLDNKYPDMKVIFINKIVDYFVDYIIGYIIEL